jgi:hypothetical protein
LAAVEKKTSDRDDHRADDKIKPRCHSYLSESYAVRLHWVRKILKMMGYNLNNDLRDCFADPGNARFKKFWTIREDALQQQWSNQETMWCNPPWTIWEQVAKKILQSRSVVIAVFPAWHSKTWVQQLLLAACKVMYFEVGSRVFELGGKPVQGIKWGLFAALIVPSPVPDLPAEVGSVSCTPAAKRRWRRKQQKARAQW